MAIQQEFKNISKQLKTCGVTNKKIPNKKIPNKTHVLFPCCRTTFGNLKVQIWRKKMQTKNVT